MSYCENKDTAAVIYNFKDSEEKIFVVGKVTEVTDSNLIRQLRIDIIGTRRPNI